MYSQKQKVQENWYRFNHWSYVDIFIYFGHYTVTVPPPNLIEEGHRHGVKVLGTLIFEWEHGAKEAKMMLEGKVGIDLEDMKYSRIDPLGNRMYANKLVEIAKHYGFDGYLMNFEC